MNSQPTKRRNPFATPIVTEEVQENETNEVEIHEEPVYEEPVVIQKPVSRVVPQTKQPKVVTRQTYYQPDEANREKYTSTMDITLRRQIKIACATRGIMFAKFVEDACREKLAREGVR